MKKYRHEQKYLIHEGEIESIKSRLIPAFYPDPHANGGSYMIRSLYFDDMWNSAYNEKDAGVLQRQKYRIRIYDCKDSFIRLERKAKWGAYICKESAKLTREETDMVLRGDYDFLLGKESNLLKEFYVELTCRMLRPRVVVDYDREPFLIDEGTVRVTFDRHIRAGYGSLDIFDPDLPSVDVMDPGLHIMEVKYTEFLPDIVRTLVVPRAADYTAASKYVLCCDKTQYLHGYGYYCENMGGV